MTPEMTSDDLLSRRLGGLPTPALPPALRERVRARAGAAFARAERPPARLSGLATGAAVASAIFVYVTWAVEFLAALAG
jgi:hypothetical protein